MAKRRNNQGATARITDFAEDLGRFLGSAQRKAESWLGERKQVAKRLAEIRDTATQLLGQLGETTTRGRRGRLAAARNAAAGNDATTRRGRRRGMSAAQRKAVSARMKKYWAARKKQRA